ncbi:TatD family hydrolase [Rhodoferax sp. 4810]|uniref:TatD family hydrolase n=1 Tax=Thiospirillum jenense TaxID=1653858 RepID=A0A839HAV1_9GAMM|nr:TatD family hydrolase [Thiospirillum jenense]MBB1073193.1 TatD family hydrolase [Rhodoferax jenense]MBB1124646.1 TatD family hydrolase [Thiospirillum jenense]
MFVDSHCHLDRLDLTPYAGDFAALMAQQRIANVSAMLCVGIDLTHYPAMRQLIAPYSDVWCSVGVHPNETVTHEPTVAELVQFAADERVVAIGETGLDYYRSHGDLTWQHRRFIQHIAAARECGKPLIIHSRAAPDDTLAILKRERANEVGGVMHCFSETWEIAQQALDLGFYISFTGVITFKAANELRDVARQVPLDRLLIETDAPYLAPVPHRGQSNEPQYVQYTAAQLAELKQMRVDELAAVTRANFFQLFNTARPVLTP